jgi:hypothetical protein
MPEKRTSTSFQISSAKWTVAKEQSILHKTEKQLFRFRTG